MACRVAYFINTISYAKRCFECEQQRNKSFNTIHTYYDRQTKYPTIGNTTMNDIGMRIFDDSIG